MRNQFASGFANSNRAAESGALYRLVQTLDDEAFVGIAIFSGIGLLAGLIAAICGVPGVWM